MSYADQGRVIEGETLIYDSVDGAVPIETMGYTFVTFQCVGTGSVTWQATIDGTNWAGVQAVKLSDGSDESVSTDAGLYRLQCSGFTSVQVASASGFTSVLARISS